MPQGPSSPSRPSSQTTHPPRRGVTRSLSSRLVGRPPEAKPTVLTLMVPSNRLWYVPGVPVPRRAPRCKGADALGRRASPRSSSLPAASEGPTADLRAAYRPHGSSPGEPLTNKSIRPSAPVFSCQKTALLDQRCSFLRYLF